MENKWKTNGFDAFLILNPMNPIPNLMNPIFGFADHYLGGGNLHMNLDLVGVGGEKPSGKFGSIRKSVGA